MKQRRFQLVDHGRPLAAIEVGTKAPPPVKLAANELRRYLREMSGADLPIHTRANAEHAVRIRPIRRSSKSQIPNPKSQIPRPTPSRDDDSYQITVAPSGVLIRTLAQPTSPRAAGRPVLFGVYDLLEQLGCGFCIPGDDSIPHRPSLSLPFSQRTATPAFTYRGQVEFPLRSLGQSVALLDWMAKNRLNWYHPAANARSLPVRRQPKATAERARHWIDRRDTVSAAAAQRGLQLHFGGHTMMTWVPVEYFADHPDWFALVDGKRGGDPANIAKALCVTNHAMQRQLVRNMRRFLGENPEVEILDIWHPDSDHFCHCKVCLRGVAPAPSGETTEAVGMAYLRSFIDFANAISQDLQKTHPRVHVGPLVNYSQSTNWPMPAGAELHEGVLIGLAHFPPLRDSYRPLAGEPFSAGNARLLGIDMSWKAAAKDAYLYEYYHSWYRPFIHPHVRMAAHDLPLLRSLGFTGISSDQYGWTPVNMYAACRLMWEPSLSPDALIRDFCRRYYGSAADAMAAYWMSLETDIHGRPGYLSYPSTMMVFRRQRERRVAELRAIAASVKDETVRRRVESCTLPWLHFDEKDAARYWAVPAFQEENAEMAAKIL